MEKTYPEKNKSYRKQQLYYFENKFVNFKMNQTPTYLTVAFKEQLAQLIKRMPDGEELIVSKQGIRWKKNGEEQEIHVTSRRQLTLTNI